MILLNLCYNLKYIIKKKNECEMLMMLMELLFIDFD